jgi:vacuolar-type H+-ATPase subunit I/STV1
MAEEFRFFLRTAVWVVIAGVVYWLLSYELSGTILLGALLVAILAFVGVGLALAQARPVPEGSGPRAWLNRVIGFHERPDAPAPLEAGAELVPLSSASPVISAAAIVLVGLGLIFGSWLIVPGVVLLVVGGIGWLTQLDGVEGA